MSASEVSQLQKQKRQLRTERGGGGQLARPAHGSAVTLGVFVEEAEDTRRRFHLDPVP